MSSISMRIRYSSSTMRSPGAFEVMSFPASVPSGRGRGTSMRAEHAKNAAEGQLRMKAGQNQDVGRMEFLLALRKRGIMDQALLRAMDEVPRAEFVSPDCADAAYSDQALPIDCGQTISQPYVVAYMTEQLELKPTHRVLEVGTGSGYQAAVLSRLAREV